MKTDVGLVSIDELCFVWPDASMVIEEYGQKWLETEDLRGIYKELKADRLDLWLATRDNQLDLVAICGGQVTREERTYHIYWCGGRGLKRHMKAGLTQIERYASLHNVTEVVIGGRPGWNRLLAPLGYGPRESLRKNVRILWSN